MLQFKTSGVVFQWQIKYPCCIIDVKSKKFPAILKKIDFLPVKFVYKKIITGRNYNHF